MADKPNAFAKFSQQKEAEQEHVEAKLTGKPPSKIGRPRKWKESVTVNIVLALDDKMKLVELAEYETVGMNDLVTRRIRRCSREGMKRDE